MKAIVLVGGRGTRIAELTGGTIPKPMLQVAGRPFLAHHLDWLVDQGVETIVLAAHHLAEVIAGHFKTLYRGVPILYSLEERPAGTGGAIRRALAALPGEPHVVVSNGDTYFPVELDGLLAFHQSKQADVTLALAEISEASRYGAVEIDADGRIRRFLEKAGQGRALINGGVYVVSSRILDQSLPEPCSFERDVLEPGVGRLAMYGLASAAPFWDIGVPDDYRRFERAVLSRCAS